MSKARWTSEQFKKQGLVEGPHGTFVPIKSLVAKKVDKISPGIPMFNEAPGRISISGGDYSINGSPFTKKDGLVNVGDVVTVRDNTGNKKIRNATKTIIDGISFDSRLEAHLYGLLKGAGITFEFQKVYWLMENFKYRGETIRGIKIIMDFYLPTRNILIDSKGWQTYDGKLKHKMLKQHLKTVENNEPEILMPSTKKECDLLLNKLLYNA